ncbi:MAG: radical SAM family heme chaperone HemW [Muribaculaceae bacterium]
MYQMAGIYIHIPFCKRRCSYCDFYSVTSLKSSWQYVESLGKELDMRIGELSGADISTIYIGGGTPSALTIEQLGAVFDMLRSKGVMADACEVTIEVNPDDVTPELVAALRTYGVNRVSMGVQSFVDEELKAVNRRHNAQEAIDAIDVLKRGGISNISIDLIYGLPLQTLQSWAHSLDVALAMDVSHISAYCLSYEEGTALTRLRDMGRIKEADEELCVAMYEMLCQRLSYAGYEHYEISNFAKPGCYSQHNSSYWNGTPYLGLGAGAHSYDGNVRSYNPCDILAYMRCVAEGKVACVAEEELWWQRYNEMVMVRLRTKWGIDVDVVGRQFGENIAMRFRRIADEYVLQSVMQCNGSIYALTQNGVMLSDAIIRELMYVEY